MPKYNQNDTLRKELNKSRMCNRRKKLSQEEIKEQRKTS